MDTQTAAASVINAPALRALPHQDPTPLKPFAVVIAGADCWLEDLARTQRLLAGEPYDLYLVNDQIEYRGEEYARAGCSLHPSKLTGWLQRRVQKGYPTLGTMWGHREHPNVQKHTPDWGGSGGLFAAKIARQEGHLKIILCGVTMSPEENHFVRRQVWTAAIAFRKSWVDHYQEYGPFVRCWKGWAAERVGIPTQEWLRGPPEYWRPGVKTIPH